MHKNMPFLSGFCSERYFELWKRPKNNQNYTKMSAIILKTGVRDKLVINKTISAHAILCVVRHPKVTEQTIKNPNKDIYWKGY